MSQEISFAPPPPSLGAAAEQDDQHPEQDENETPPTAAANINSEDSLTVQTVLERIESLAVVLAQALDACQMPLLEQHQQQPTSRSTSTTTTTTTRTSRKTMTKRFNLQQCRSFTSVLLVLAYCHSLLLSSLNNDDDDDDDGDPDSDVFGSFRSSNRKKTTTTREVYYFYVTHFRSQRECDTAIWDACQLLQVPRHALGLQAGSRGWFCGDVRLVSRGRSTNDNNGCIILWDGQVYAGDQGCPVASDWLLPESQRPFEIVSTTATSILVIEKEGIYQRLVQDGFHRQHRCILVTGKGFPDLATRAAVHAMHQTLQLPVRGLADCDPFGVLVLHTYSQGGGGISSSQQQQQQQSSSVDGRGGDRYSVPMEWIGLRPSQVKHLSQPTTTTVDDGSTTTTTTQWPALPSAVFQELTELDRKRLTEHLLDESHKFTNNTCGNNNNKQRRLDELHDMLDSKVELEALHWLGMDFCATFVGHLLEHHEAKQQRQRERQLEGYDDEDDDENEQEEENDDDDMGWMDII